MLHGNFDESQSSIPARNLLEIAKDYVVEASGDICDSSQMSISNIYHSHYLINTLHMPSDSYFLVIFISLPYQMQWFLIDVEGWKDVAEVICQAWRNSSFFQQVSSIQHRVEQNVATWLEAHLHVSKFSVFITLLKKGNFLQTKIQSEAFTRSDNTLMPQWNDEMVLMKQFEESDSSTKKTCSAVVHLDILTKWTCLCHISVGKALLSISMIFWKRHHYSYFKHERKT